MAERYGRGAGVRKDEAEAYRWCRRSAEQGYAAGEAALGLMYWYGTGVAIDAPQAIRWLTRAANHGDPLGQYSLAFALQSGFGVRKDEPAALRWFHRAAEKEYAPAEYALCRASESDPQVPKSVAVAWCRKAAEHGDMIASAFVGFSYAKGRGVVQDYGEAFRWYKRAAERGNANAKYALGYLYDTGCGVARSEDEAIMWYGKASSQGDQGARRALERIRGLHPRAQISKWSIPAAALVAIAFIFIPERLWGRAAWFPWAAISAISAAMLSHQLLMSTSTLVLLTSGSHRWLFTGLGRNVFIGVLELGTLYSGVVAVALAFGRPRSTLESLD